MARNVLYIKKTSKSLDSNIIYQKALRKVPSHLNARFYINFQLFLKSKTTIHWINNNRSHRCAQLGNGGHFMLKFASGPKFGAGIDGAD